MKIHMVLQGKGGVGKSFVAALMAQFLQDKGRDPVCIDTDPVNATFAGYSAFGVHAIELVDGRDINPRRFDSLVERIAGAGSESEHVIVDNGASSFLPLADYMLSYDVPGLLAEMGARFVVVDRRGPNAAWLESEFAQSLSVIDDDSNLVVLEIPEST